MSYRIHLRTYYRVRIPLGRHKIYFSTLFVSVSAERLWMHVFTEPYVAKRRNTSGASILLVRNVLESALSPFVRNITLSNLETSRRISCRLVQCLFDCLQLYNRQISYHRFGNSGVPKCFILQSTAARSARGVEQARSRPS